MATVNLGKVGMTLKGVYDNEVQYEKLDVVYYDDSTYCAKVSTKGNTPSKEDDTYWQLLVAPNPLATWKPNTKDDEGYVEKGDGHTDSLWATDSDGNPAWVKKEDVATKVETNSKTADGIVTKGQDNLNKVWATDSEGNPAWREYNFSKVLDTSTWDSDKKGSTRYFRIIAKVKASKSAQGAYSYQSVSFNAENTNSPYSSSEILWCTFNSRGVWPSYVYVGMHIIGSLGSNIFSNLKSFFNGSGGKPDVYLAISFNGVADGNIIISNLRISPDIEEFEWLWDDNKYIDMAQCGTVGYEFYNYTPINASVLQYDPIVSYNSAGLVPSLPGSHNNMLLATDSSGTLGWQSISSLGFQTSAQVQEAISAAIASADFSSFEIVSAVPDPSEAKENKFYLVKNEDTQHYDIYALLGDKVERIDDTTVDLSNYVTKEEGKQLSTEDFTTAYKNKLDGIPEGGGGGEVNIINTVKVNGTALVPDAEKAVDVKAYNEDNKPKVGGRNLLLGSGKTISNSDYPLAIYKITEVLNEGEIMTCSLKIKLGKDREGVELYNSGWENALAISYGLGTELGIIKCTFKWKLCGSNDELYVFTPPASKTSQNTIEWIKLERGEIATDWSPAPEDLEPTASHFAGILPIEKGGTGNNNGRIPVVSGNEVRFAAGDSTKELFIGYINGWKTYRFHADMDTMAAIKCGTITSPSIPTVATTSTAGLVKPGSGLSISDDGTLSLSQETLQQMIDDAVQKALSS